MTPSGLLYTFLMLVLGHCLADFPLQGDFLARAKNHRNPIAGISWVICLLAHSTIHAGAVYYVTRNGWMAFGELVIHSCIDYGKSEEFYGFTVDQALHILTKAVWALFLYGV